MLEVGSWRVDVGTLHDEHLHTSGLGSFHLFAETATQSALLREDGLWTELFDELACLLVLVAVIHQMVLRKAFPTGYLARLLTVEYTHPAFVLLPEPAQTSYRLHARQGQQSTDALLLHLADSLFVVAAPRDVVGMGWVDAFVANKGDACVLSCLPQVVVKLFGKGVGSIDDEADGMFTAEGLNGWHIHSARYPPAADQAHRLLAPARRIIIRCTGFFQHLYGSAPLCCSSEN